MWVSQLWLFLHPKLYDCRCRHITVITDGRLDMIYYYMFYVLFLTDFVFQYFFADKHTGDCVYNSVDMLMTDEQQQLGIVSSITVAMQWGDMWPWYEERHERAWRVWK